MQGKTLGEGLVYNCSNIADVRVPLTGLEMFRLWFGQRNFPHPFSNGWMYDMGKLVILNVFPDIDLLRAVATRYDPVTRVIRDNDGRALLSINREEFWQVFDLSEPSMFLVPIDLEEMKREYGKLKSLFRVKLLPPHLARAGGSRFHIRPNDQEPFKLNCFSNHFLATFYPLSEKSKEAIRIMLPLGTTPQMVFFKKIPKVYPTSFWKNKIWHHSIVWEKSSFTFPSKVVFMDTTNLPHNLCKSHS